jgi:uncharacterized protein with ParB-like and HNH nuclease domain
MNNMTDNQKKSEKLTFLQLIEKYKIEIPIIQRDYAQGREGKEELRESFLSALYNAVADEQSLELDFIYGSLENGKLQPLDGQQRLTTLFLLHWFIAIKENKLDDQLKNLLKNFTYETRISSREFCNELIEKGITYESNSGQKISEIIKDNSWFFLSWKKDPTIKSMLTMLDDIEEKFREKENVWDKLNNISFHFIELENFGLSDDLYIKMNARGKPLTDFENFKAKFEKYIKDNEWEKNTKVEETFSYKVDTGWADFFWNYRNKITNTFGESILNFFRTFAYNEKEKEIKDVEEKKKFKENFTQNIDILIRGKEKISFGKYLELGCFDEEYFKTLKNVLNKISDKNGLKTFLQNSSIIDEKKIFKNVIENNLSYPDLVITFAYYKYLALEENIELENLQSWLRIVRNLVEGSRLYLFNDAIEFAEAINSINKLLQSRNSIVDYFENMGNDQSIQGFLSIQVNEEKIKAKLFKKEKWKNAIIEIENHGYFKGQIGFLLDWCKGENEEHNIDKFKEYADKAKAVFISDDQRNEDLNHFNDFLFERALLAKEDYLLKSGQNYSFLIDNDRDISWKRLLRDNNKVLISLVDEIKPKSLTEDLKKIIEDFSDKNDWRYYFVKYPEMIKECGNQKLIRWKDKYDILLLGSAKTSGYHKEYYSYSLFIQLKNELKINEGETFKYYEQRSAFEPKYFKINNKKITFDVEKSKENKKEFYKIEYNGETDYREREELIEEIKKDIQIS